MKENTSNKTRIQGKSVTGRLKSAVEVLREKFRSSLGLPVAQVLPESEIQATLDDLKIGYRKRLFCPIVTLWAWLSQVLDHDKSSKKAVSRVIAYLVCALSPVVRSLIARSVQSTTQKSICFEACFVTFTGVMWFWETDSTGHTLTSVYWLSVGLIACSGSTGDANVTFAVECG